MKKSDVQMSETFLTGVLLALGGGFLDAYTYICRGGVFANAQTGNMVLLGLHLAQGKVVAGMTYVIPILAFALGVVIAEVLRGRCRAWKKLHWRQIAVFAEVVILVIVAMLPQGKMDTTANVLVSFVCAMQVQTFRKMNGSAFATTMCTGNLRNGTELLVNFFKNGDKELLKRGFAYYGIILFFMVGAGLGAVLTAMQGQWAVLSVAVILLVVFGLMFVKNEETEDEQR